jgi:hypothetical protein
MPAPVPAEAETGLTLWQDWDRLERLPGAGDWNWETGREFPPRPDYKEEGTMQKTMNSILLMVLGCGLYGCGDQAVGTPPAPVSSRAYKGHADDQDMNNLVSVYPAIVGTRLDDCQSCHTGGVVVVGGRRQFKNPCDYCHFIPFPAEGVSEAPVSYEQTLNLYGLAYKQAGRNVEAIRLLASLDSDGDGFANQEEIKDLRYPGSAESKPGQPRARLLVLDMEDLRAMPAHQQFMLVNTHKQRFDTYARYKGVMLKDLLSAVGVELEEISGVTLIAADGYMKDFEVELIRQPFPKGLFFASLDTSAMGECGFVEYPSILPSGLVDGGEIPGAQWLLLAYERGGEPLDTAYLDPASGRLNSEGPLRIIVPQSRPGAPDRGSVHSPSNCNDRYDYDDANDHNAGNMVRGIVALRVNPMPEGYEEFDAMNGGWAYVDAGQLVIYGKGID